MNFAGLLLIVILLLHVKCSSVMNETFYNSGLIDSSLQLRASSIDN